MSAANADSGRRRAADLRGQSWPTWGPKNTFFREILPDSAESSSCDPRTPVAGVYRSGRVVWGVLGRFRGGVSIYVLGGFRLVLNSNRIEIVKLGGSDRAARARGATNSDRPHQAAASLRLRAGHSRRRATWRAGNARHASLGRGFERRSQLGARQTEARRGEARRGEATAQAPHTVTLGRRSRRSPPYGSPRLPAAC